MTPVLTILYAATPGWVHRAQRRLLGITDAAAHEWLCAALGCRCLPW